MLSSKDPNYSRRLEACGDLAAAWARKQTSQAGLDSDIQLLDLITRATRAATRARQAVPIISHAIHGAQAPSVFDFCTVAATLCKTYTANQSQMTEMQQNPSDTAYSQLTDMQKLEICKDLAKVWIDKCPKDEYFKAELEDATKQLQTVFGVDLAPEVDTRRLPRRLQLERFDVPATTEPHGTRSYRSLHTLVHCGR